jgi:hypothetical protein
MRVVHFSLLISWFALIFAGTTAVLGQQWGNVSGTFVYGGSPPTPIPLQVTKDVEVCGKHKLVAESLVVSPDKGLANVVVYLNLGRRDKPPAVHPSYGESAESSIRLDNIDCRFEPHVALLRTNQTLLIGNKDPVGHNTKIDCISNASINPIVAAGAELPHKFSEAERLPATVSCNVHPWMSAYLVIKDNPYFAVTDENGHFEIQNMPVGKWSFQFWHEKPGYVKEVVRNGRSEKWNKGRLEIDVKPGENDLGTIEVPASLFE